MATFKLSRYFDNFIKLSSNKWLLKNLPAEKLITLNYKNIFILPSRFGVGYLVSCVMLYFVAANYQNNLIFFLLYFLLSFMLTCLFLSYKNMAGLQLKGSSSPNQYANQDCLFRLRVNSLKDNKLEQINFSFKDGKASLDAVVSEQQVLLYAKSAKRGRFNPGRVTLRSNFPCGLFNVWTHVDLKLSCVLYPTPIEDSKNIKSIASHCQADQEFSGLKEYQVGESLKSVAWKQVAQGRGWYSKQFETPVASQVHLQLADFSNMEIEQALSNLCSQVLQLEQQSTPYSLKLGSESILVASGESHKQACLTALALYGEQ